MTSDSLVKNGDFDLNFLSGNMSKYECPLDWESSKVLEGLGGPVISLDSGCWAPSPIPCRARSYLVLQPYNDREICFVRQHLTLKTHTKYSLSFYGVSRPYYPKGTLVITIGSTEIFEEELPDVWTKYTLHYTTSTNPIPTISLINYGLDANDVNMQHGCQHPFCYATAVACIYMKEIETVLPF